MLVTSSYPLKNFFYPAQFVSTVHPTHNGAIVKKLNMEEERINKRFNNWTARQKDKSKKGTIMEGGKKRILITKQLNKKDRDKEIEMGRISEVRSC